MSKPKVPNLTVETIDNIWDHPKEFGFKRNSMLELLCHYARIGIEIEQRTHAIKEKLDKAPTYKLEDDFCTEDLSDPLPCVDVNCPVHGGKP